MLDRFFANFLKLLLFLMVTALVLMLIERDSRIRTQRQQNTKSSSAYPGGAVHTIRHDGHWLIKDNRDGALLHHPDCPKCNGVQE